MLPKMRVSAKSLGVDYMAAVAGGFGAALGAYFAGLAFRAIIRAFVAPARLN